MLDPFSSQPKSARKKTEKNGASLLDYNYTTLNIDEVYAIYMYKPAITLATKYMYIFSFDVDLHRPKKARGNEKDKLPSGVEPRSNDQQTSTPDTEPRSPNKSLSPHSLL